MPILGLLTVLAAAMATFGCFVYALKRLPALGVIASCVVVLIAWEYPQLPPLFSLQGSNFYATDLIAASCLIVAVLNFKQTLLNLGASAWLLIGLLSMLTLSFTLGIGLAGVGSSTNEFRLFLYPLGYLLWSVSLRWSDVKCKELLRHTATWLGWALVMVALVHISRHGLGGTAEFTESISGVEQTTRPLVSGQALVLLMCSAISFWSWAAKSRSFYFYQAVMFIVIVVTSQQRTVWFVAVAALAGVLIVGSLIVKIRILFASIVLASALVVVLVVTPLGPVVDQLQQAAQSSGTYDARVVSWNNLIAESIERGLGTVLFGSPMGIGFGRLEGFDRWVTFAPHNWYLTLYLRAGLAGLTLFVAFVVAVFFRALRLHANMASIAIAIMMAVYAWSYSWQWYTCFFAGWAYAITSHGVERMDNNDLPVSRIELGVTSESPPRLRATRMLG